MLGFEKIVERLNKGNNSSIFNPFKVGDVVAIKEVELAYAMMNGYTPERSIDSLDGNKVIFYFEDIDGGPAITVAITKELPNGNHVLTPCHSYDSDEFDQMALAEIGFFVEH